MPGITVAAMLHMVSIHWGSHGQLIQQVNVYEIIIKRRNCQGPRPLKQLLSWSHDWTYSSTSPYFLRVSLVGWAFCFVWGTAKFEATVWIWGSLHLAARQFRSSRIFQGLAQARSRLICTELRDVVIKCFWSDCRILVVRSRIYRVLGRKNRAVSVSHAFFQKLLCSLVGSGFERHLTANANSTGIITSLIPLRRLRIATLAFLLFTCDYNYYWLLLLNSLLLVILLLLVAF